MSPGQYALGCILYRLLTGSLPFSDPSPGNVMRMHVHAQVIAPRIRCPELRISDELEGMVLRTLAKRREDRFPSMRELAHALSAEIKRMVSAADEEAAGPRIGPPPAAPEKSPSVDLPAPRRARPLRIAAVSMLALLIGAGALLAYGLLRRAPRGGAAEPDVATLRPPALRILKDDLQAGPEALRSGALLMLGRSHEVELRDAIEPLLADPSLEVRAQAAYALGHLGDAHAVPALQRQLDQAPGPSVRVAAAYALDQLGAETGSRVLSEALAGEGDPDDLRLRAAFLLCEQGDARALGRIRAWLDQGSLPAGVQVSALSCLGRSGDAAAIEKLRGRLTAVSAPEQRLLTAARLAKLREPQGLLYLRGLVEIAGPQQLLAARYLATPEEPKAVGLLREVVRTPATDPTARRTALEGLGEGGGAEDARLCAPLLASPDRVLRQSAAGAIVQLTQLLPAVLAAQSTRWARAALDDQSWLVRAAAATTLADSSEAGDVTRLAGLLGDRDERVRRAAVQALGGRNEEGALVALRRATGDSSVTVRASAWRSLVKVAAALRKSGNTLVLPELMRWARERLPQASPETQVMVRSALHDLGDPAQSAELLLLSDTTDPEVRKRLVEQLGSNIDLLVKLVRDVVFGVRFAAAQRLAALSDLRAVPVLREALALGGQDGLVAYRLLRRLGVSAEAPTDLQILLASSSVAERLAAVETLGSLPGAQAAVLLLRAMRDPEVQVRRKAAEVASELADGEARALVLPLLRQLLEDRSAVVRNRVAALLAKRPPALAASEKAPLPPAPALPVPDAGTLATTTESTMQPGSASAPEEPATAADPIVDQATQLLRGGGAALDRKDYQRALKLLTRANLTCSRARPGRALAATLDACSTLQYETSYQIGRVYQAQGQWAEAMTELTKAQSQGARLRTKTGHRAEIESAIAQLLPRVGRVLIERMVKGRCQQGTQWVPPGRHAIDVDGQRQIVSVGAGQSVSIGACP